MDHGLYALAEMVGTALKTRAQSLVTAESCTGGWIGEAITMVPGSSLWFDRGFITYTYVSKTEMLGVSAQTLERHGAVSEQTVKEMAAGALAASHAYVAVAVSGTAGPGGGTAEKPVGTVCLAWALRNAEPVAETHRFDGDRESVRRQTVVRALEGVLERVR
jgi:nicotinamide-nucleotide amidase